jgi:hypothetical protein
MDAADHGFGRAVRSNGTFTDRGRLDLVGVLWIG